MPVNLLFLSNTVSSVKIGVVKFTCLLWSQWSVNSLLRIFSFFCFNSYFLLVISYCVYTRPFFFPWLTTSLSTLLTKKWDFDLLNCTHWFFYALLLQVLLLMYAVINCCVFFFWHFSCNLIHWFLKLLYGYWNYLCLF